MPRRIRNAKKSYRPNLREIRTPVDPIIYDHRLHDRLKRVELLPRNLTQESYIDALTNDSKHVIFAIGPAGSGKTLLATEYAIKSLQEGLYDKIVITRPAVSVDEQHGYLPGDLVEKMQPWMLPILDVFKKYYSVKALAHMLANEVIEIAPLAFMRGRTFTNAIIIADEMQNSTVSQTKMVLTRIGPKSRLIITGDLHQHDRGFEINGMKDFIDRLRHSHCDGIAVIEFTPKDVERHPIIEHILRIYDDRIAPVLQIAS